MPAIQDAVPVFLLGLILGALLMGFAWHMRRKVANGGVSQRLPSERRLYGIIQSAIEPIITIDHQQTIIIFNPAAERVFRCAASDAIGTSLSRFIPARFRDAHGGFVARFGMTGVSERQMGMGRQVWGLRCDGEEFPMEASISQWQDAQGKLYTVQLRDITERERINRELEVSQIELTRLSTAIQNIREEEKSHIARELHDDLGQSLTAMKMELSVLENVLAGGGPHINAHAERLHVLIDATVASVRRIASNLRPIMLDDLGLFAAIEWLAQDFHERYGIAVNLRVDGEQTRIQGEMSTALFRIVQEALTNAARHADATHIDVLLKCAAGSVRVDIQDDGRGATPHETRKPESFGLLGIRERARLLGGRTTIDSAPGQGFRLTVMIPVVPADKAPS